MYFLILEATPPADEPEAGGAFVSCWVEANNAEDAEQVARYAVEGKGWTTLEASEQRPVARQEYLGTESLGY